jgi:hypothetical protein
LSAGTHTGPESLASDAGPVSRVPYR